MNIAVVSKLWEETSPLSRGGTGASIGTLVNGLSEAGHHVTLFATGDSDSKAHQLVSVRKKPYRGDYSEVHEYENIAEAFRRHDDFDVIHCAVEHKSVLFGDLVKTPSLHSIRYGEFFDHELNLLKKYKHLNFVTNSKAVTELLPFLNWKGYVYNGVDPDLFPYSEEKEDYFLFLSRISPQKGADKAIEAALKLNKKLVLAGKMSETDRDFLDRSVLPYIDGERIIYEGEISSSKKLKLLKKASAVVQPTNTFEACSNTLLEAMACGTPVVVSDKGSNRELVEDGVTGYLIRDKRQLAGKLKKVNRIQPEACRQRVEKLFSKEKMVKDYENIYKQIVKLRRKKGGASCP
jgi:glycosyltransferase involved in cell wall biosynthesis